MIRLTADLEKKKAFEELNRTILKGRSVKDISIEERRKVDAFWMSNYRQSDKYKKLKESGKLDSSTEKQVGKNIERLKQGKAQIPFASKKSKDLKSSGHKVKKDIKKSIVNRETKSLIKSESHKKTKIHRKHPVKPSQKIQGASEIAGLHKKANGNLKLASGMFVSKYGIGSIFRPKFWALKLSSLTLSKPEPLIITILALAILCSIWLFGLASLAYSVYFAESVACAFLNVFLTIGNAIWFGFYALTQLITMAFIHLINAVAHYFMSPLIDAINILSDALSNIPVLNWVFTGDLISFEPIPFATLPTPDTALSYYLPQPIEFDINGEMVLASLGVFIPIKPGIDPYIVDDAGQIEFETVAVVNMAEIQFPKMNPEAFADDWIADYATGPPIVQIFSGGLTFFDSFTMYFTIVETASMIIWDNLNTAAQNALSITYRPFRLSDIETKGMGGTEDIWDQDYNKKIELYNHWKMPWLYMPYDIASRYDGVNLIHDEHGTYFNWYYFLFNSAPVFPGEPVYADDNIRRAMKIGEYADEDDFDSRYWPIYYLGETYYITNEGKLMQGEIIPGGT